MSISSRASSEAEEIQRIAYELWQIDGEPFGREGEHWERARRIFESRKAFSGNGHDREAREPEEAPRLTPTCRTISRRTFPIRRWTASRGPCRTCRGKDLIGGEAAGPARARGRQVTRSRALAMPFSS